MGRGWRWRHGTCGRERKKHVEILLIDVNRQGNRSRHVMPSNKAINLGNLVLFCFINLVALPSHIMATDTRQA